MSLALSAICFIAGVALFCIANAAIRSATGTRLVKTVARSEITALFITILLAFGTAGTIAAAAAMPGAGWVEPVAAMLVMTVAGIAAIWLSNSLSRQSVAANRPEMPGKRLPGRRTAA